MKRNLLTIVVPAAMAASFLAGCSTERITARTQPGRPSIVQVSEGYDTVGRRWETQALPAVMQPGASTVRIYTAPEPVAQVTIEPAPAEQPKTLTRSATEIHHYTGTISDIDYAGRELTLKDSQGNSETFSVSKDVQRFGEAKVGDKVELTYFLGMNAQVRQPTAEEQQNPLVILQATGRAGANEEPGAMGAQQIRAVVTIEALDRAAQTLTVKGPRGRYYTARVADPSRFDDVHIGDTIVMTFTEAMAVSLDPAK